MHFTVLPTWDTPTRITMGTLLRTSTSRWSPCSGGGPAVEAVDGLQGLLMRRVMVSPSSGKRIFWDILCMNAIAYETCVIPLEFLDLPESNFLIVVGWVVRLLFTLDMLASLLTGFNHSDGSLELCPTKVARRYAVTWLLFDVMVVGADWAEVFMDRGGRALRIMGMFRLLRLIRLVRLRVIIDMLIDRVKSEKATLLIGICKTLCAIIGVAHAMACSWIGLGREGGGWVPEWGLEADFRRWELYVFSFHWSLTNFAGVMELGPHTLQERYFAIAALLFGFVVASSFISEITTLMTRLSIIASQKTSRFKELNKYLQEHGISQLLASRVHINARYALSELGRNCHEEDIELLQLVSQPLRVELHFEIHSPTLRAHPLFRRLLVLAPRSMRQVCHQAVGNLFLSEGDVLFSRGEVPDHPQMLFLTCGDLAYTTEVDTSGVDEGSEEQTRAVGPGEWACEQVLWTSWVFHGTLYASGASQLLTVDAARFQTVLSGSACQGSGLDIAKYAREFIKQLNQRPNSRSDLGSAEDTENRVILAEGTSGFDDVASSQPMGSGGCVGGHKDLRRGSVHVLGSIVRKVRGGESPHPPTKVLPIQEKALAAGGAAAAGAAAPADHDNGNCVTFLDISPKHGNE